MSTRARIHLMPVVMTAAAALLALKVVGVATHTSHIFTSPAAAASPKAAPPPAEPKGEPAPRPVEVKPDPLLEMSPAERELLGALKQRREEIEARAGDLDLRENLLKAAEKRMEDRLEELKRLEAQVAASDARRAEEEDGKIKNLIVMYEGMKVKDAARIFDRLDPGVLHQVASRMNPKKLSEVLGQMTPEAAERLTVALARRDGAKPAAQPVAMRELPKIEGRPAQP